MFNKPTYYDTIVEHMQTCNKCFVEKPLSEYYKYARNSSGHEYSCKDCRKIYRSNLWREHKDEMYSRNRKWAKANPHKFYEYQKNQGREKLSANHRKWASKNREHLRDKANKRRAMIANNGIYEILPKHMKLLYASPCIYCGATENISLDHVIPVSRGGTHGIGNLVSACLSCNSSKHNHFITEWKKRKRSS